MGDARAARLTGGCPFVLIPKAWTAASVPKLYYLISVSAPDLRMPAHFPRDTLATLEGYAVPTSTGDAADCCWPREAKVEPGWLLMGLGICQGLLSFVFIAIM